MADDILTEYLRKRMARIFREELRYLRVLLSTCKQIRVLVDTLSGEPSRLERALRMYAEALVPWAEVVAGRMLADVADMDLTEWRRHSRVISRELREEIEKTPLGQIFQDRMHSEVELITSIPREAAERVHKLVIESQIAGWTSTHLVAEIRRTVEVSESRARLIARTEVGRAATEFHRIRAQSIGSTHYIWRALDDALTRPWHRRLNGSVQEWDKPPQCEPTGEHAHPGCIWNCRCVPEAILPDTPVLMGLE
jgi:SPP1 gp7 family putative phage head morphogenesis protein